ncbi:MAG: energy coupling factor transporter S component ThiW [Candidatus Galacturonibacter soehngenii]|nr:energy coupling factor transporter S component ThiW [Candidatus Galacturonibacter soehngenii]
MKVKKLALAGVLVAMGVVCSAFYIPIGVAKAFPVQHFVNVIAAVVLGPVYGVGMAFATSLLRNVMGTGSLLAFPGSMCGALLSGLMYRYSKNIYGAVLGEVFGTGIVGAILAYPIAALFLSSTVAIYGFILPFLTSTVVGSSLSLLLLITLKRSSVLFRLQHGEEI